MKIFIKPLVLLTSLLVSNQLFAQLLATDEGFDDVGSLTSWTMVNNSSPLGDNSWFQGEVSSRIVAQHGTNTDSYIAVNHRSTQALNDGQLKTICNYLVLPDLGNLATFSFYTRSVSAANNFNIYPDRLFLVYSPTGEINTGNCTDGFGDFSETLQVINPDLTKEITYPEGYPLTEWTKIDTDVNGNGRLAFVYFVEDAGFFGTNSNYIGIDTVEWTIAPNTENKIFSTSFEN